MQLLAGHMLDKLLYLNADLKKCITHHILVNRDTKWLPPVSKFKEKSPSAKMSTNDELKYATEDWLKGQLRTILFYRHWKSPKLL